MYNCSMCRLTFDGEPAMENNVGPFCEACKTTIIKRSMESNRQTATLKRQGMGTDGVDRCLWCASELDPGNRERGENSSICQTCAPRRSWLLKCIRRSKHPAIYAAKCEDRESVGRAKRWASYNSTQKALADSPPEDKKAESDGDRLTRIEELLAKLMGELGVKE